MILSAIEVKDKLVELWPRLERNNAFKPWDRRFYLPTVEEMHSRIEAIKSIEICISVESSDQFIKILDLYNIGEVWDCDDFAHLSYTLNRLIGKQDDKGAPEAYGVVQGFRFRGMNMLHALNLVMTQEGIYFIDWSDNARTWKADPENDDIFYVSM